MDGIRRLGMPNQVRISDFTKILPVEILTLEIERSLEGEAIKLGYKDFKDILVRGKKGEYGSIVQATMDKAATYLLLRDKSKMS